MILTDDELSALWDGAVASMRTSAEPWHIRHRMGRAVESAVLDRLIAEAQLGMANALNANRVMEAGEYAWTGDWLRSKRGE